MKRVLSMLFALIMVFALMGCAANKTETQAAKTETQAEVAKTDSETATAEAPAAAEGATIGYGIKEDVGDLSPWGSYTIYAFAVTQQIYDLLIYWDDGFNMVPGLAESWELNEDGTEVTFHLRKNAKDSNGNEITASDIIWSMATAQQSNGYAASANYVVVDESKVIDDYTVMLKLISSGANALKNACKVFICDEDSYKASPDGMVTTPVGSGAYKVNDYVSGSYCELVKNEYYWGETGNVDKVIYKYISEPSQRTTALETGEIDYIYECQAGDMEYLNGKDGLATGTHSLGNTYNVYMNCSEFSPCNDVKLRQAIALAINSEAITSVLFPGICTPAKASFAPGIGDYDKVWEGSSYFGYDVEAAKKLVAESSYDGSTLTIFNIDMGSQAEMIQNMLSQIGITSEIQVCERSAARTVMCDEPETWDLFVNKIFSKGYASSSIEFELRTRNFDNYDMSDEFAAKLDRALVTMDDNERKALTNEMLTVLNEELPWYAISDAPFLYAYNDKLTNLAFYNDDTLDIKTLVVK